MAAELPRDDDYYGGGGSGSGGGGSGGGGGGGEDPAAADEPVKYRVCILGQNGTGKTALVNQFLTSEYMNTYDASLGKSSPVRGKKITFSKMEEERDSYQRCQFCFKNG